MPVDTLTPVSVDDSGPALLVGRDPDRAMVEFHNQGTNTVYLGGDDVTDTDGIPLVADESRVVSSPSQYDLSPKMDWYAICAGTETATVRILVTTL